MNVCTILHYCDTAEINQYSRDGTAESQTPVRIIHQTGATIVQQLIEFPLNNHDYNK